MKNFSKFYEILSSTFCYELLKIFNCSCFTCFLDTDGLVAKLNDWIVFHLFKHELYYKRHTQHCISKCCWWKQLNCFVTFTTILQDFHLFTKKSNWGEVSFLSKKKKKKWGFLWIQAVKPNALRAKKQPNENVLIISYFFMLLLWARENIW